jgi:hypothetical protein
MLKTLLVFFCLKGRPGNDFCFQFQDVLIKLACFCARGRRRKIVGNDVISSECNVVMCQIPMAVWKKRKKNRRQGEMLTLLIVETGTSAWLNPRFLAMVVPVELPE